MNLSGGGYNLLKPTDLQKHNAIYINETDEILMDDDYGYVTITLGNLIIDTNWKASILERLQNGELTKIDTSELSSGDTIVLLPCLYGFCLSVSPSTLDIDGSYSYSICNFSVDISHYKTNKITDFSGMFVGCNSITGIDRLNTSNGKKFDYMFHNSPINKVAIDLSSAESANFDFPMVKYATLNLTGSRVSKYGLNGTIPDEEYIRITNLVDNTSHFFNKSNNPTLRNIIADDIDMAYFVDEILIKESITNVSITKPNGIIWDLN